MELVQEIKSNQMVRITNLKECMSANVFTPAADIDQHYTDKYQGGEDCSSVFSNGYKQ